jgi:hypothetical protein
MSDPTNGAGLPGDEPTPPNLQQTTRAVAPPPVAAAAPVTAIGNRRVGKARNPWAVWIFSIITLGIYQLYWYYKVNSEAKEYDQSIEVSPGLATFALIVPIAGWVSIWRYAGRLNRVEAKAGSNERTSPILGIVLVFVFGFWVVYYQMQLNKVWVQHGSQPEATLV